MINVCEYCGSEPRYGHTAVCVMNTVEEQRVEIERLRALIEDGCKVFEHYDLPEHALHYRRKLDPLSNGQHGGKP